MISMMDFADTDLKILFTIMFKNLKARGIKGENKGLQYNTINQIYEKENHI